MSCKAHRGSDMKSVSTAAPPVGVDCLEKNRIIRLKNYTINCYRNNVGINNDDLGDGAAVCDAIATSEESDDDDQKKQ